MLSVVGSVAVRGVFPLIYLDSILGHCIPIYSGVKDKRLKQTNESKLFSEKIGKLKSLYGLKGTIYMRQGKAVNAIHIVEKNYTMVIGNSLAFYSSPKIIYIDSFFQKTDFDASKFWLSYACCQLKNNDDVIKDAVLIVINLAAAFFSPSLYMVILIGIISHITIQNTFGTYSANRAFSTALKYASAEEIMGALRLLNARVAVERELSGQSRAAKIQIWFSHILYGSPSLKNFIHKAEGVLKSKNNTSDFSQITSDPKYLKMKGYLLNGEKREKLLSSAPKR